MTNNIPFCLAPWVSIQYGTMNNGGVTPCCEWRGESFKGSLSSYFNSSWLNDIKSAMLANDIEFLSQSCRECINTEKLNIESTRQLLHKKKLKTDDGLKIIDYRPNNLCNLKCRMCSAEHSSMIAKEENRIIPNYDTSDIYSLNFSSISKINILGGEPSISADVDNFLTFLVNSNYSKNIDLYITTNGTNTNKRWIDLITKFKHCHLIISVDGTGKIYEYIRTNANWNSVLKNIKTYQSYNFNINFQITGSMYNMPVVDEWIEWFFDKKCNLYSVEGVELSLSALNDEIRQEKIEYLKRYNYPITNTAIELLSSSTFNSEIYNKFKMYTNYFDKKRKTNLIDVSPTFKRILM